MSSMLAYMDKLSEPDTAGVEPMSHVFPLQNVFREDVVTNDAQQDKMLQNAPRQRNNMFVVPQIFDGQ